MSNIRKKSIAGLLILVMLASAVLIPQAGEVKATGEAKDISEGPIELTGGGEYILTGTTTTAANVVTIEASDQPYVVTLDNVSISSTKIPVTVKAGAKVTFISKTGTENSFTTTTNRISAIEVQTGSTVIFEGDGTVNATSTQHAGAIGAGRYDATSQGAYVAEDKDFGTIIINSGIINAKCTSGGGAGIGGGYNTAGGTIIINGGNITATSANNAAAIGDGYVSASKAIVKNTEVIINGGTISTTTVGGDGIGYASSTGDIDVNNMHVTINGGNIISSFRFIGSGTTIGRTATVKNRNTEIKIDCSEISSDDTIDAVYVNGKNYNISDLTTGKMLTVYTPRTYFSGTEGTATAIYNAEDADIVVVDEGNVHIYNVTYSTRTPDATVEDERVVTKLENAFGYLGASIRTSGNTGIRFGHIISNELRDASDKYEVKEYGVIVQKQNQLTISNDALLDDITKLPGSSVDFTLKQDLTPTTGVKGIAYKPEEMIDIIYEQDASETMYAAVLHSISEGNYATDYSVKPYIVLEMDGMQQVIYGDVNTENMYDIAKAALADPNPQVPLTEDETEFLEGIVSTVEAV